MRRPALLLLLALALAACSAPPRVVVSDPPPPLRLETPPKKPANHVFWQDGHWAWQAEDGIYFWSTGGWEAERPGELWIPGYWRKVELEGAKGWEWVDPRWEPIPKKT